MAPTPQPPAHTSTATETSAARTPAAPFPPAAFAVLPAAAAGLLAVLVVLRWGPLMSVDTAVTNALHRVAVSSPGWTRVNRLFSDWVWDPWAMRAMLAAAVWWLLRRGERRLAWWVAGTALAGTALQQALKALVDRARPVWEDPVDHAHYAAYPSGHAMSVLVAGALLLWLLRLHRARPRWQWAAGAVAGISVVGVGFTRVYLGVHWLSDVVGGWLLGAALVAGAASAYGALPRRTDTPAPGQEPER
ncbi:phosphatase PAP2 family protein [Streptomyces sp. Pv4-95]|uniref:phosphatase PAP2 family protein n=1 Tax=Streptomyces sp. Pv4-95 TaxID=3049543 RepID=UPI003891ED8B